MTVKFKKLTPTAMLPHYAHVGDSGMDVASVESVKIIPHSFALIRSGLAIELPDGYELQVRPRSGLQCRHGIVGAFGTVDSGYRGEIKVAIYNHSNDVYTVEQGDRIAQFVIAPVIQANIEEVDELSESDRGANGFGSTGK